MKNLVFTYDVVCNSIGINNVEVIMATNLNIDMKLLNYAFQISGLKTKRETVNKALKEYIENHRQKEILNFLNTVEYDEDYDNKKSRN